MTSEYQPDYFKKSSRDSLRLAYQIATQARHETVRAYHVLLAMTRLPETDAYHALRACDIINAKLTPYLRHHYPSAQTHPLRYRGAHYADDIQLIFQQAMLAAYEHGEHYIGSAHLLIGMMQMANKSIIGVLDHFGCTPETVIEAASDYCEHSLETPKYHIRVDAPAPDDAQGCLKLIYELMHLSE